MFHAYVQRFNVMQNLEKFFGTKQGLNKNLRRLMHL